MTFPRTHTHPHPQAERNAVVTQTSPRQTGRMTAILGVATVAATAAVISFSHVQALARTAGEPELTAWLLPLSIDGAIAAAAAVVLAASKAGRRPTLLTLSLIHISAPTRPY